MNRLRKLLGVYVALVMLVSNTVGVVAAEDPFDDFFNFKLPFGQSKSKDISQFGKTDWQQSQRDYERDKAKTNQKSSAHGEAMATKTPESEDEKEEGDGGGGGGCDGGGSGGGGGGGLGGMLGKMMESLLPLLMMMMMMQQNKNNQPPTPGALPTIPPTFTPLQRSTAVPLFTAVPSAAPSASRVAAANEETTAGQGTNAADTRASTEAALFPTLPPMQ